VHINITIVSIAPELLLAIVHILFGSYRVAQEYLAMRVSVLSTKKKTLGAVHACTYTHYIHIGLLAFDSQALDYM